MNEDIGDSESVVPASDLDPSYIEVSVMGSSEVSSGHTVFGDEGDDNSGPNIVNDTMVTTITIESIN